MPRGEIGHHLQQSRGIQTDALRPRPVPGKRVGLGAGEDDDRDAGVFELVAKRELFGIRGDVDEHHVALPRQAQVAQLRDEGRDADAGGDHEHRRRRARGRTKSPHTPVTASCWPGSTSASAFL
jgi:hypothetical protein